MFIELNVQQQNNVAFDAMLATASRYRAHGVNDAVREFFADQGIAVDRCAIVHTQEDYALGMEHGFGGLLVTEQDRFYAFELELDAAHARVLHVHEFEDTTAQQNLSGQNRGRGKGAGLLALAVLTLLNGALAPSPSQPWPPVSLHDPVRADSNAV